MPYPSIDEVSERVGSHLTNHAQKIYVEALNNAWEQHAESKKRRSDESREEKPSRWAAVKQKYEKDEKSGKWKEKNYRLYEAVV
jgi:cation transport regulator